jgi:ribosomal protein L7Ae-like RNA K-turn-binding protein
MENKITLSLAIRNQIKLVLLANSIGREELVTIALDKLEELINLIPQDIDSNGKRCVFLANKIWRSENEKYI